MGFISVPETRKIPSELGMLPSMLPSLTAGSINRILDGEVVTGAVMQILGYKKVPEIDRYRLIISDSMNVCHFVILGAQLNSLVTNKELEKFTVANVDKCVCGQILPDRKVIILLSLTVLIPGSDVGEKIGNPVPVNSTTCASTKPNSNSNKPRSVFKVEPKIEDTSQMNGSMNSSIESVLRMFELFGMLPNLTAGSINRILDGEVVTGAVMQILGYRKIPGSRIDRYRLFISDSVNVCSFVMLSTQLNSLVTNKELEKFTIVRVDECFCTRMLQPNRKIIILMRLTVLTPGAEVNEKIDNPVPAKAEDMSQMNSYMPSVH